MQTRHFALRHYPFKDAPEPGDLFPARGQLEAEARLGHLIEMRGIGLLTGEAGCGKTTVCRKVCEGLHSGLFKVAYISLTTGSILDLYNLIAAELGLERATSRHGAWRAIRADVSRRLGETRQLSLLVIDEAHLLHNELLEELRLLTNFRMDSERRLVLLLTGLTELRRRLTMAVHESLAQRIVVRCHLPGLERDEAEAYVAHRMRLAGADVPLFEKNAIEAIFDLARGVPRKVDTFAHHALHAAAVDKARQVTLEHVHQAREDLEP